MSGDVVSTKNLYDYIEERIQRAVEEDIAAGTATYYSHRNKQVYAVIRTPEEAELLRKERDELLTRIDKEKAKLSSFFNEDDYEKVVIGIREHCRKPRG